MDYEPQAELFPQSPSVSKTNSAKPSCESTGPMSQSLTTSENLKETRNPPLQMELTSSAEGSRASLGVSPGSSEAQKMTVISGRSWLPLLKSYGLDGSLAKMCEALLTNRWASSAAFLTWKASDIKPSHLLFQLAPSMPRTDATESGLWATPRTTDGTGGPRKLDEKGRRISQSNPKLVFGANLADQVRMWPMPIATDGSKCPTGSLAKVIEAGHPYLNKDGTPIAHKKDWWSTPTTSDSKGAPKNRFAGAEHSHGNLSEQVRDAPSSGQLNPQWVEWVMGFPTGWTDLKPSEMPLSRKSSRKSAKQSSRQSNDN